MDTSTCTTIVLVLIWLYLCCQALGSLVALIRIDSTSVLSNTITLSTVLLGVCLWQCKKAGYLVSTMTWYHWVLLVLLVLLQIMVIILEHKGWNFSKHKGPSSYPIYGIVVVLLGILGGTLFCGWKCNLFCRPCCKSQYICYGSTIVVVLVILIVLVVTASLVQHQRTGEEHPYYDGGYESVTIGYLSRILLLITQCYTMAMIWNTIFRLPYTVSEVMALLASTLAMASILAVTVPPTTMLYLQVPPSAVAYSFLAVHLLSLGITLYCLEYKTVFYWPKDYMCFGILAAVVILVSLMAIVVAYSTELRKQLGSVEHTLLGYSFLLMVPTLWYAYRCGLLTWRWTSCVPKKKGIMATATADNTTADSEIADE